MISRRVTFAAFAARNLRTPDTTVSAMPNRKLFLRLLAAAAAGWGAAAMGASGVRAQGAAETPKEIIAAHIRMQGFACEKPLNAERDRERSKPDEPVWLLKCENATYRVRLIPDMAAQVQRVD